METNLTLDQAREILAAGHDAYGRVRIYGVIADGPSAGQMVAIKSSYYLEREPYARIYTVTNDGMVPIRKA